MMANILSRREMFTGLAAAALAGLSGCRPGSPPKSVRDDLALLDLSEAAAFVRTREVSPVELTTACLDRIAKIDPRLHSFITVTGDQALADARRAENEIKHGRWLGPLHGIPIGVKDNIDTAGIRTTAASAVFAERTPERDAEVIAKLKTAGAIIIGKLNMHEFAGGTTSAISHFGAVHNPWNIEHIAGGSSGGNGAAVAAGLCYGSVGTDTGGSIRIPAASCGIVGLKPTYDVVPTEGLIYVSRSFDHIGPMCRTVADTAIMFRAMTGHPVANEFDPSSPSATSGLRVGLLPHTVPTCDAPVEAEVRDTFDEAMLIIRGLVAEVRDAELPMPELGDIIGGEEYAFHAQYLANTRELYDPRTRDNIMEGKKVSTADLSRMRNELADHRRTIVRSFENVDVVAVPTLPGLPITLKDATDPFTLNACTFAFSIAGLPAISVPCGFSKSGLPIGLMLGGPPLSEGRLLTLANAYEKATGWERHRPAI